MDTGAPNHSPKPTPARSPPPISQDVSLFSLPQFDHEFVARIFTPACFGIYPKITLGFKNAFSLSISNDYKELAVSKGFQTLGDLEIGH